MIAKKRGQDPIKFWTSMVNPITQQGRRTRNLINISGLTLVIERSGSITLSRYLSPRYWAQSRLSILWGVRGLCRGLLRSALSVVGLKVRPRPTPCVNLLNLFGLNASDHNRIFHVKPGPAHGLKPSQATGRPGFGP